MLLVTATDMAVLCGNNGEVAWSKYGAYPLRAKYCHEMAVRMLLQSIENAAIKYRRHIVPVISLSIDFYIRVFVRVYTSPIATKEGYLDGQCVRCTPEFDSCEKAALKEGVPLQEVYRAAEQALNQERSPGRAHP